MLVGFIREIGTGGLWRKESLDLAIAPSEDI